VRDNAQHRPGQDDAGAKRRRIEMAGADSSEQPRSNEDRAPEGPSDLKREAWGGVLKRTVAEFRELAREAGLDVTIAERAPSGAFVVECRTS